LRVDASAFGSGVSHDTKLILELQDVKGVFRTDGGITWLTLPPGASDRVTLLQFHLPDGARIERLSPEPVASTRMLNRLVVTVAGEINGLEVIE